MENPQVWYMVKEAVENLRGELAYSDIKKYINKKWVNVNQNTITFQIIAASVNHISRIHYNENKNPRFTNTGSHFDLLYNLGRGKAVKYDPLIHGVWEIYKNEDGITKMKYITKNAFLFSWNSNFWPFEKIEPQINDIKKSGKALDIWSISAHRKVKIGDRAFLIRVKAAINGIFASGTIISEPEWFKNFEGNDKLGVWIEFDTILNPNEGEILELEYIKENISLKQDWSPRKSGISITPINELEILWANYLRQKNFFKSSTIPDPIIIEGTSYELTQTVYERNPYARIFCLQHHGYSCAVCGFNFKDKYGEIGNEFIHVHHLNQLSISRKRETDPIIDLCPVCPNCHAMLHKRTPPYSIEELKNQMLQ